MYVTYVNILFQILTPVSRIIELIYELIPDIFCFTSRTPIAPPKQMLHSLNLEIVEKSTVTNRQSLSVLTLNLINIIHAGKPPLLFRKFLRSGIVHFYIKLWTLETRANI